MGGGRFLLLFSIVLFSSSLVTAAVLGADSKSAKAKDSSGMSANVPNAPPAAEIKPIVDLYHGTKVVDNYRWLEDGGSPATEKWVGEEMSYTRAILDPLPGRDAIHKRLTDLLTIGNITAPTIAGKHYFYTKREGMQNQPVLYVRDELNGPDRVLVDANQLASDGTIALDWFQPSENGKYVAYGTSPSGSEMSTLHIIETKTGTILPDTIERTRAASIAWLHDNSGFYYTRYPKKGTFPQVRRCTTATSSSTLSETILNMMIPFSAKDAMRKTGPACRCPMTDAGSLLMCRRDGQNQNSSSRT